MLCIGISNANKCSLLNKAMGNDNSWMKDEIKAKEVNRLSMSLGVHYESDYQKNKRLVVDLRKQGLSVLEIMFQVNYP
ncbi:MAG: hypothetical protein K8V42_05380, partial [Enterococcus aquimarinus]|nr:hypothetical protein [Enterococcus aquimarinus]